MQYALVPLARWERRQLVVERVDVFVRNLPAPFNGFRLAFLTDLHLSPIVPTWWLEAAVERAVRLEPDVVTLGGDFVDDDPHYIGDVAPLLSSLSAPLGVYAVLGNHDHYVGAAAVRRQLAEAGVRELLNEHVLLERGGAVLALAGVGDLAEDVIDFGRTLTGVADDTPRVVLSHDPDVFAYWPDSLRLDLMLSGHTHGGQAHLPVIGPPFVPSQFGARYLRGLFREGSRQLYVSRGVGASGVPFRWKCPPELTLAVLRSSR